MGDYEKYDFRYIEQTYNLKFTSRQNEVLFFEMFNTLLTSRIALSRRSFFRPKIGRQVYRPTGLARQKPTELDINICLAALCAISWPGKTAQYQREIEAVKRLYYENQIARNFILSALRSSLNPDFINLTSSKSSYFRSLGDLFSIRGL